MEITSNKRVKVLAYYLPQFYPFKENDEWWGKGFTEWTNVGKAKPLFRGHYQPKVPGELGYYDLRLPEVAEEQARLARDAGVFGFCYWHYWFGNGRTLLEMPIQRAIKTGKPDFPFCFAWANESWKRKQWSVDGKNVVIMEQLYPGAKDNEEHFYHCLDAFKDERYVRYDGRPVFVIYKPFDFDHVEEFIKQWNELIKSNGIADSFYFIGMINLNSEHKKLLELGFDAATLHHMARLRTDRRFLQKSKRWLQVHLLTKLSRPVLIDYRKYIKEVWEPKFDSRDDVVPTLVPNWDHSPRSGIKTPIFINTTPQNWDKLVEKVVGEVKKKKNKMIILRSWNEWGEGNYIEPDLKYGRQFIDILGEHINKQ